MGLWPGELITRILWYFSRILTIKLCLANHSQTLELEPVKSLKSIFVNLQNFLTSSLIQSGQLFSNFMYLTQLKLTVRYTQSTVSKYKLLATVCLKWHVASYYFLHLSSYDYCIVIINSEMNVLLYCLDIVHCSVVNGMGYSISKNDFMLEWKWKVVHQQTVNNAGNIIC